MFLKWFNIFFILIVFHAILVSCVGTIEDTEIERTQNAETEVLSIPFAGLQSANAISHQAVEISFFPADGDPEFITYEIYVNNSETPIFVSGSSLSPNPKGLLNYTVSGLETNTTYSFGVSATNNKTGAVSDEGESEFVKTFSNTTASFDGISSVRLPAGTQGQSSVIVEWIPAKILGTAFFTRSTDPVAYEITYISEVGGPENLNNENYLGSDRVVDIFPNPISSSPTVSEERSRTINGLASGVEYYFQVRAIHKGFIDNDGENDVSYKHEENNKFLKIETASALGVYDFEVTSLESFSPEGENALIKIDLTWLPAIGDFFNYRIFYTEVSNPDELDVLEEESLDEIISGSGSGTMEIITADNSFHSLNSLSPFTNYQFKVVTCRTPACSSGDRTLSILGKRATFPSIAPFEGISTIDHPRDESATDSIYLTFNPPVVSSGYLNDMDVMCYSSSSDNDPVVLIKDATYPSLGDGQVPKTGCDGLTLRTSNPSSLESWGSFDEISISGIIPDDGEEYCFSLVPIISPDPQPDPLVGWSDIRDVENAIVKCIVPKIKTPTLEEFPGKDIACDVNERSLTMSWEAPTNGIYTNYEVYLKESDGTAFKFSEAKAGDSDYTVVSNILKSETSYTFNDLVPGRRYHTAVLAYLDDGVTKFYSESNLNTSDCLIPFPEAEFDFWHNIVSIGPKIDGLIPRDNDGKFTYLVETFDNDDLPVEVLIDDAGEGIDIDVDFALYNERQGTGTFDGVYGAVDGDDTKTKFQYSNNGLVKIQWKDVTFYDQSVNLSDLSAIYEDPATDKGDRSHGYKVYRSDDGRLSWTELTTDSASGGSLFQKTSNKGLVKAEDVAWLKLSNAVAENDKVVSFTDYSVISAPDGYDTERAVEYWYKVVPIFDGKIVTFKNGSTENIIKVTLPPPNMALVHRNMANRTICNELGKDIQKTSGGTYYCHYNGIGASGLYDNGAIGSTVYDIGGDLLIDRFEIGCNWTRGSSSTATNLEGTNNSIFDVGGITGAGNGENLAVFQGKASSGGYLNGCVAREGTTYEPLSADEYGESYGPGVTGVNWRKVRVGDCFARGDSLSLPYYKCNDSTKVNRYYIQSPGLSSNESPSPLLCTGSVEDSYFGENDNTNFVNFGDGQDSFNFQNHQAQSEYAAVWYYRGPPGGSQLLQLPGAGGSERYLRYASSSNNYQVTTSCLVNLPIALRPEDESSNRNWTARWMPVNRLFSNLEYVYDSNGAGGFNSTTPVENLFNKTISEILSDSDSTPLYGSTGTLYANSSEKPDTGFDSDNFAVRKRYNAGTTKLAKIFSSNNSKLPPLTSLSQKDAFDVCSTYEVDIGLIDKDGNWNSTIEAPLSKRLMRKKEFNVAAAWPEKSNYDETVINELENGTHEDTSFITSLSEENQACNNLSKITNGQGSITSSDLISPHFVFSNGSSSHYPLITGSSNLDNIESSSDLKNRSTQKCVSKWGIQDLVGNVKEYIAEQIHCDFSGESLYMGPTITDPPTSAVKITSIGRSGDNFDCGGGSGEGSLGAGTGSCSSGSDYTVNSLNPNYLYGYPYLKGPGGLYTWSDSSENSGECSTIEWGSDRLIGSNPTQFNSDINFNSIFSGVNNLNPEIVDPGINGYIRTFDYNALNDVRNGDGAFLDFGQERLAVPFKHINSLSLRDTNSSKYFNPVLGLPLICGGTSCNDILSSEGDIVTSDNRLVTTTFFGSGLDVDEPVFDPDYGNDIFPIHNSEISNPSLGQTTDYSQIELPNTINNYSFISEVDTEGLGTGLGSDTNDLITITHPDDSLNLFFISGGSTDQVVSTEWTVDRNIPLFMLVGGGSEDTYAGRYTAQFVGQSKLQQRLGSNNGFRCAVKINKN